MAVTPFPSATPSAPLAAACSRARVVPARAKGLGTSLRRALWVAAGLVCAPALLLSGCASDMSRTALPDKARVEKLNHLSMPAHVIGLDDESYDQGADVISTQRSDLVPTALDDSDPLPKYHVPWLSFVNTPLQDVLQAIVADYLPLS